MSFNTDSIAEKVRGGIEELIALATGEKSKESSADQMERCIWWKLLEVGRYLMQLFFAARREAAEADRQIERNGEVYPYKGQRKREYVSVFGKVTVWRGAYWKRGSGSVYPLDEALSLPERQYSDWVQEIVSEVSVNQAYEEAVGWVQKWLPIRQPKRSAQQLVADHARLVASYYEQQLPPQPDEQETILVVSADGKGIPMNREHSPPLAARRGKGSKKTAKKDATVTALYTIAPYRRSADEVLHALLPETMPPTCSPEQRPSPTGKQVFGTLAGKDPAFRQVVQQAAKRQAGQLKDRVALTDGSRALQLKVEEHLPDFTLILDIIHVTEYLWEAANTLLGETHPGRPWWVADALRCLLSDDHHSLFLHLERQLSRSGLSVGNRKTLNKVLNYLRRNLPYMDYQRYLALGWPIGTGVVEGACRHLVKDRFERAGMRWSVAGAQALLDLRAVYLNQDWDDFQRFRRHSVHQQRFGSLHPELLAVSSLAA
jgi:hypothetical protein